MPKAQIYEDRLLIGNSAEDWRRSGNGKDGFILRTVAFVDGRWHFFGQRPVNDEVSRDTPEAFAPR